MASIRHEVWIDAPRRRVFELLSTAEAISTWWDEQTRKETPDGVVFEHSPGPEHGTVQFLVLKSIPSHTVRWRCISTHPAGVPASDWTNTEIAFFLGDRSSSEVATGTWAKDFPVQTVLMLEHSGWPEGSKYLPFCNYAWAHVLGNLASKAAG